MAIADNLLAYWRFDESSGSIADSVASYTGTYNGALYSQTGKIGTSLGFDGTNDYVSIADGSDTLKDQTSGSVSLWLNTNTISVQKVLMAAGDTTSSGYPYFFLAINNQEIMLSGHTGTNNVEATGNVITATNTWYHVVWTNDGSTNKVYLNGTDQGALTLVTGSAGYWFGDVTGTDTFAIGAVDRNGDYAPWDGEIDEIGIWSRAITQAEVTSLYNSGDGYRPIANDYTETFSESFSMIDLFGRELQGIVTKVFEVNFG